MIRQYVGARYVPKFADPVAWASGTSYEAMTIVTYNNSSYTSKIPVPATVGNPADNPDYWALTGNYNAQVEQYRQETETVSNNLTTLQGQITTVSNNLTTEITNRKNADTTLQDNITSEAATRASTDSNLQAQINQIVAPSGEAPSAAEVQNARIGADGVTYDTLGTAIRTQVDELKGDLDGVDSRFSESITEIEGRVSTGAFDLCADKKAFALGGYNTSGIFDKTAKNAIGRVNAVKISRGTKINIILNGLQVRLYYLSSNNGGYIGRSDWITSDMEYVAEFDGYVSPSFKKLDSSLFPPDFTDLLTSNLFVYNTYAEKVKNELKEDIETVKSTSAYELKENIETVKSTSVWVGTSGSRNPITVKTNGTGLIVSVPNRLMFIGLADEIVVKDFTEQTFNLLHNDVLYWDINAENFGVVNSNSLNTIGKPYVILCYANNGKALGQWERYFILDSLATKKEINALQHGTTIFVSRQGEVNGNTQHSVQGILDSKKYGYTHIRVSVQFTSDGVPVLLHDANLGAAFPVWDGDVQITNGGLISTYSLATLNQYTYGNTHEPLMTLATCVELCKKIGLKLLLEFKQNTLPSFENMEYAYNIVANHGMTDEVIWNGYNKKYLSYITQIDAKAHMGYIAKPVSQVEIDKACELLTGENDVIFNLYDSDMPNFTTELHQYGAKKHVRFKVGSAYSGNQIRSFYKCEMIESTVNYPADEIEA